MTFHSFSKPTFCVLTALTLVSGSGAAPRPGTMVPLYDLKFGYLMGGSRDGKWVSVKAAAPALKTGATLRIFNATRQLGSARASAPQSQDAPCPDTLYSKFSPDFSRQNADFALGGTHNPFPRAVQRESTHQPLYRGIVAGILQAHGIKKPVVQIQQIWRVDLDGDGAQEVLLCAARKDDQGGQLRIGPASRAGDYSLLLLRKLVGGRVQNIVIEGAFYPRAKTFNAPSFTQLAAVLDADGDGKMEVLIRGYYYEGEWSSLYAIEGAKPREVLSEGCGA